MKRLSYRYTKDNDEELNKIAKYLADSKPLQAAAEIYSDIEEMKNIMIDGMCHFVFTKVNYCCPLKVSEQRDIHPQCCCNGIADDFSEGKPLS